MCFSAEWLRVHQNGRWDDCHVSALDSLLRKRPSTKQRIIRDTSYMAQKQYYSASTTASGLILLLISSSTWRSLRQWPDVTWSLVRRQRNAAAWWAA